MPDGAVKPNAGAWWPQCAEAQRKRKKVQAIRSSAVSSCGCFSPFVSFKSPQMTGMTSDFVTEVMP